MVVVVVIVAAVAAAAALAFVNYACLFILIGFCMFAILWMVGMLYINYF